MGRYIPREEKIARIRLKIAKHKAKGGSIYDSKDKLDYYGDIIQLIKIDKKQGKQSTIETIYKECGEAYISKKYPVITIESIKKKIDSFIDNGGDIYDKKENIPYYSDMINFIKTQQRHNNIISIKDIYSMCGYEYINKKPNEMEILIKFNEYKDDEGFIDSIRDSEEDVSYYNSVLDRAKELNMDINPYLICFYGVRLKDRWENVDYVKMVEEELHEFAKKHDGRVNCGYIRKHDLQLFYKISHLARFFPLGSITTSAVIRFFGYDVKNEEKNLNEKALLKYLEEFYPDRKIESIRQEIYNKVVVASVYYDMTIEQYLNSKGYKYLCDPKSNKNHFRLSKTKIERDDKTYNALCAYRDELISASDILNNEKYSYKLKSKEIKMIALKVYEKYLQMNKVR